MLEELEKKNIKAWDDVLKNIDTDANSYKNLYPTDITILVKNQEGLRELYTLVSDSNVKHFYREPRILKTLLSKNRSGLLIGSGNNQSALFQAILSGKTDEELEEIAEFYDFLEVQPISNHEYLLAKQMVNNEKEIEEINKKIIEIGKKLNKIVVATGDSYFMKPEDKLFVEMLDVAQKKRDADIQPDTSLKNTEQMLECFRIFG